MWKMKELYINSLNSKTDEELVEFWWDNDKYRNESISMQDVREVFGV